MVDSVNNNPYAQFSSASKETKKNDELGRDDFMTLMLAQMQHQDPLNPVENGDFMAQLAQFQTTSEMTRLNQSFDQFAYTMQSSQALQASSLVGREVLIPGNWGHLPTEGTLNGSVQLPASSSSVRLNIYSTSGSLLGQVALGSHPAGQAAFSWDGRLADGTMLPPGSYQLEAEAVIGGKVEAVSTSVAAKVESVSLSAGREPVLNLAHVGPMAFSQVSEIR